MVRGDIDPLFFRVGKVFHDWRLVGTEGPARRVRDYWVCTRCGHEHSNLRYLNDAEPKIPGGSVDLAYDCQEIANRTVMKIMES